MKLKLYLLTAVLSLIVPIGLGAQTDGTKLLDKSFNQGQITTVNFPTEYSKDAKPEFLYRPQLAPSTANESSNTVKVSCARGFDDTNTYNPRQWGYTFLDENKKRITYINQINREDSILQLPKGKYDVIAFYRSPNISHSYYVIHELVEINSDTVVSINPAEATVNIQFEPYLPNGEKCYPETCLIEDNGRQSVLDEGNVGNLKFTSSILLKDGTWVEGIGSFWANIWTGTEERDLTHSQDIHINPVSDRFVFVCNMNFPKYYFDNSWYVVDFEVSTCKDTIMSNKPEDYVLHEEYFKQTPKGLESNQGLNPGWMILYCTKGEYWGSRYLASGGLVLGENETNKCYICTAQEDESPVTTFVSLLAGDMPAPWDPDFTSLYTVNMPVILRDGNLFHANRGLVHFDDFSNYICPDSEAENGYRYDSPLDAYNPQFSYPIDKTKTIPGNSCPILVPAYSIQSDGMGGFIKNVICGGYQIGRNGEHHETGMIASHTSVKVDGAMFADVNGVFPYNWTKNADSQGLVDITVTNENVDVDGVSGKNVTITHFDKAGDDNTAPTLQMLDFRDLDDNATDRFVTANEGKLQFCCGDFNEQYVNSRYYQQYNVCTKPVIVEVAYSPYQAAEWTPLDVSEEAEFYYRGMGHYFSGSLASVNQTSENGWFDLKFRLVDEAGNWQEQTLSPAFRIDNLVQSAVTEVKTDHTAADTAIYNLAGQRMRGDLYALPHGIYIMNGKKVVK